ncbi:enterotoxin, partial [Bacillus anthracis]|nr:enterotoxin [Bacillus anthracis]
ETTNQIQTEWLQFEYNGKTAYVHGPYLTGTAPVIEKQEQPAPAKAVAPAKAPAAQAKQAAKPAVKAANTSAPAGGRELTVVATAYTAHPSDNGGTYFGRVLTSIGHVLTANPNLKIFSVDPLVIPLFSKVWVEGYGESIAGDTCGAFSCNRIVILL